VTAFKRILTDEEITELIHKYVEEFVPLSQLATDYRIGMHTLRKVLQQHGCRLRTQREAAAVSRAREQAASPPKYLPSPDEIQAKAEEFQSQWTPSELRQHLSGVSRVPWQVPEAKGYNPFNQARGGVKQSG
jgi:hypothetical protein